MKDKEITYLAGRYAHGYPLRGYTDRERAAIVSGIRYFGEYMARAMDRVLGWNKMEKPARKALDLSARLAAVRDMCAVAYPKEGRAPYPTERGAVEL